MLLYVEVPSPFNLLLLSSVRPERAIADFAVLLVACARAPARASGPINWPRPTTPDSRPTSPAAPNTPVGGEGPQAMSEEQIFVLLEEALGAIGNCNRTFRQNFLTY